MLTIIVPAQDLFDEAKEEFIVVKEQKLQLEHSLVSISKWESKWKKPYLTKDKKTLEETIDYVRCMTITQNVNPNVYYALSAENYRDIQAYIEDPMSATTFSDINKPSREIITSEVLYYAMFANNVPLECQKWHLNRLLNLLHIFSIKNQPEKKMSRAQILERNRAINEARKAKLKTKG
jgi:hypothetical protein